MDFLPAEKRIRYSLAALKNIGAQAVESLVAERTAKGPFADLSDFAGRCDPKALNKRALETLAAAGAFDGFDRNRALVQGNVEAILAFANRTAENAAQGTGDLFGGGGGGDARPRVDLRPVKNWTPMEKLQHEFDAVGFFLSGHPLDAYAGVLGKLGVVSFSELEARADRGATAGRLAGVVVNARERRSQKGNKFAFAMFSEPTGQFEAVIFSETLAQSRQLLEPGTAVLINVEGERDGEALKLRAQSIESLDKAAEGVQKGVKVVLDGRSLKGGCGARPERQPRWRQRAPRRPQGPPQAQRQGHHLPQHRPGGEGPRGRDRAAGALRHLAGAEGGDLHRAGGAGGVGRVRPILCNLQRFRVLRIFVRAGGGSDDE